MTRKFWAFLLLLTLPFFKNILWFYGRNEFAVDDLMNEWMNRVGLTRRRRKAEKSSEFCFQGQGKTTNLASKQAQDSQKVNIRPRFVLNEWLSSNDDDDESIRSDGGGIEWTSTTCSIEFHPSLNWANMNFVCVCSDWMFEFVRFDCLFLDAQVLCFPKKKRSSEHHVAEYHRRCRIIIIITTNNQTHTEYCFPF